MQRTSKRTLIPSMETTLVCIILCRISEDSSSCSWFPRLNWNWIETEMTEMKSQLETDFTKSNSKSISRRFAKVIRVNNYLNVMSITTSPPFFWRSLFKTSSLVFTQFSTLISQVMSLKKNCSRNYSRNYSRNRWSNEYKLKDCFSGNSDNDLWVEDFSFIFEAE